MWKFSNGSATSHIAVDIASDKQLTKQLLREAALPVPRGHVVESAAQAVEAWQELGCAVAVKPLDSNQGKSVSTNLNAETEVVRAFEIARQFSERVLVEEFFAGRDYRLLSVNHQLVAASERRLIAKCASHFKTIGDTRYAISEPFHKSSKIFPARACPSI